MIRALLLTALLSSCVTPTPSLAEPTPDPVPPASVATASLPDDPIEAVRFLRVVAANTPDELAAYVDQLFVGRMPSSNTLAATLGPAPVGCDIQLTREDGYGAIAIPPPMDDDSPERAAEIEAIIDALSAGVEVHGTCTMVEEGEDGEPVESTARQVAVFAVALGRGENGWRVLGWRDFTEETGQ